MIYRRTFHHVYLVVSIGLITLLILLGERLLSLLPLHSLTLEVSADIPAQDTSSVRTLLTLYCPTRQSHGPVYDAPFDGGSGGASRSPRHYFPLQSPIAVFFLPPFLI